MAGRAGPGAGGQLQQSGGRHFLRHGALDHGVSPDQRVRQAEAAQLCPAEPGEGIPAEDRPLLAGVHGGGVITQTEGPEQGNDVPQGQEHGGPAQDHQGVHSGEEHGQDDIQGCEGKNDVGQPALQEAAQVVSRVGVRLELADPVPQVRLFFPAGNDPDPRAAPPFQHRQGDPVKDHGRRSGGGLFGDEAEDAGQNNEQRVTRTLIPGEIPQDRHSQRIGGCQEGENAEDELQRFPHGDQFGARQKHDGQDQGQRRDRQGVFAKHRHRPFSLTAGGFRSPAGRPRDRSGKWKDCS